MATKRVVLRGGLEINAPLGSGGLDPILTKNQTSNEIGQIPSITPGLTPVLTNGYIYIGSSSNVATERLVIGDINITNLGLASIVPGAVDNNKVSATAAIVYSKLSLSNSILNADINTSAAITRSKLASGTAYRVIINNASGIISEAGTITGSRILLSDANGVPTFADTATYPSLTELSYVKGVTSALQTQLNNKLAFSSAITPANGDIIYYTAGAWTRLATGTSGQYLSTTGSAPQWVTTPNGVPTGGTTGQYLNKIDGTDFNAQWSTLNVSKITDLTATAAELNLMDGVTTTTNQLNYLNTTTGDVQAQIDTKQSRVLGQNSIWVGNGSNVATALGVGSNGQVLTVNGGTPTWVSPGTGGTVTSVALSGSTTGLTVTGSPITTSGTMTLGGTLVAANGGTGFASYTIGDLVQANTTTTLNKLAAVATGNVLISGGIGVVSSWGKVTSAHVDSTILATGTAWLLATGGTLTGANTITATGTNNLTFNYATLGANTGFLINSNSTDAASNTQTLFKVTQTGANATASQTTYGGYFSNTKTGTTNTNIGLYAEASGGTTNYAIDTGNGDVRFKQTNSITLSPLVGVLNFSSNANIQTQGITRLSINASPGTVTISNSASSSGSSQAFIVNAGAHTNQTASELIDINYNLARTVQFTGSTGFLTQRAFLIQAPTYAFASATGTIATAATLSITGTPVNGTNALITNPIGLYVTNSTAYSTASQTSYSGYFSSTATGTTNTNVGLYAEASGGTTNIGLAVPIGQVSFGVGVNATSGTTLTVGRTNSANAQIVAFTSGTTTAGSLLWSISSSGQIGHVNNSSITAGSSYSYNIVNTWSAATGSPTNRHIYLTPTYNFTGAVTNAYVYGFDYVPTVTSLTGTTEIAIRTTSGLIFLANSSSDTPTANTRLDVRGTGTTTNFTQRWADSANATKMTLTDAGTLTLGSTIVAQFSISSPSISGSGSNSGFSWTNTTSYGGSGTAIGYRADNAVTVTGASTITNLSFSVGSSLQVTSGTLTQINFNSSPTVAASGINNLTGFDHNPTLTGSVTGTHLAFRAVSGAVLIGASSLTAGDVSLEIGATTKALLLSRSASDIATPVDGMLHYKTGTGLRLRDAGAWVTLGAGGGWSASGATTITGNTSQTGAFTNTFALNKVTITQNALASPGSAERVFTITGGAHTSVAAGVPVIDVDIDLSRTVQMATGAVTLARSVIIQPITWSAVGSSTFTDAATFELSAPKAGTNVTITNTHGILIRALTLSGTITNSYGITINAQTGATNNYPAQFLGGTVLTSAAAGYAAIRLGSYAGNPSPTTNGDLWYNSSTNKIGARINGSTTALFFGTADTGGSIPYVTSNNALTEDNANFNYYATNKSLGLGVTSGTHQLHIKGNGANLLLVEASGGTNILEILESGGNKIGYFAATPVAQQAGLTAITHTAPGTPDYAIQDLVASTGFGFVTKDEGNTVLSVIKAMHDAMKAYGLLT